jgi:hypothetical protein
MVEPWVDSRAERLVVIDNVVGVTLGGSRTRGTDRPTSDVDIGLYYENTISRRDIDDVIRLFHDEGAELTVTEPGEWGPWINGGSWFRVGGMKADLLYRDVDRVRAVIGVCVPLADPVGVLAGLKATTSPYPPKLRAEVVKRFAWEADFQLGILERTEAGADPFYEQCGLSRVLACLVQVLYAHNERWFTNEKRAMDEVSRMPLIPDGLTEQVHEITTPGTEAIPAARALYAATMTLLQSNGSGPA